MLAYTAAIALAVTAAWFSIRVWWCCSPARRSPSSRWRRLWEVAKLVTAAFLARRWRVAAGVWRLVLAALVAGLALINGVGVFSQLVAAHVGERGAAQSAVEVHAGSIDARIEFAAGRVTDLDKQIAQIDATVAAATAKGKATTGLTAMEGQRKAHTALAGERERAAGVGRPESRARWRAAKGHQAETEAAPIVYVAEMLGVGSDSERAIRWLIALMVLCCDPLAIALTAAASARPR